jgi:hypothetical protein
LTPALTTALTFLEQPRRRRARRHMEHPRRRGR